MNDETIPFVDLYAQYLTIKVDIDAAIQDVITNSLFIRGPYVVKFEEMFAKALGVSHCVSCANGTDSLYIAMHALDVRPGDEVIVPAHSWISTSETVTQAGGTVVFCDTDSDTYTLDPHRLEEKITPRTVGIIPVHLYGQAADMAPIMAIASKYGLWVLEDCAQAHLARYNGQLVGTFGQAASFSFYPGKNLGAMGDAGAVVTNDSVLAQKMAKFARHGGLTKGDHQIEGINSRLDGLQAAVLTVKLNQLPRWTIQRQQVAKRYSELLANVPGITTPVEKTGREHVWHHYVIQHEQRDQLAGHLLRDQIHTSINYPVALPFLPAYRHLRHKPEEFPRAFRHQWRVLSLPIYPEITHQQLDRVVSSLKEFR